jgi:hypothetical protein
LSRYISTLTSSPEVVYGTTWGSAMTPVLVGLGQTALHLIDFEVAAMLFTIFEIVEGFDHPIQGMA